MKSCKVKQGLLSITIFTLLLSTHTQADQTDQGTTETNIVSNSATDTTNTESSLTQGESEKVFLPKRLEGGIALGSTRVIYPLSAKQHSISITNHSPKDRYLLNSWIDDKQGNKVKEFLVTPPLFVAEAKSENTLRIISLDLSALPKDRESVFWLNVKSIPSVDRETLNNSNLLQLAVQSKIKFFVRPNKLDKNSITIEKQISFKRTANGIEAINASPYFATITNITIDGKNIEPTMVAPFSTQEITKVTGQKIIYQLINDFGGANPVTEFNIN